MNRTEEKRHRGEAVALDNLLSADEISQILCFLKQKDAFKFALSCKSIYASVTTTVRNSNSVTISEPWTLWEALKLRHQAKLQSNRDAVNLVTAITRKNVTLSQLCTRFDIKPQNTKEPWHKANINIENLLDILTFPTGGIVDLPSRTKHDSTLVTRAFPVVIGHELTELKNDQMWLDSKDVLRILSCTPNLRSFESMVVEDRYSHQCINLDSCRYHNVEKQEPLALPQLVHLHTLRITSDGFMVPESKLERILQLTPNLTELHYTYDSYEPLTDGFLDLLIANTPKLKSLKLNNDNEDELPPCDFSDNAFVKFFKACNIEKLDIICRVEESNWMKNIGKHGQSLKSLVLHGSKTKNTYTSTALFGGGVVSSLEELILDFGWAEASEECYASVLETFPNIKKLYIGNQDASVGACWSTNLVPGLELESIQLDLLDVVPQEAFVALQKAILEQKHLRKISFGTESAYFDEEILKQFVCESVTYYRGSIQNSRSYLETFWRTFPNLRVLKIFNRKKESINKEFFNNRKHWPELEEFMYTGHKSFRIDGIKHSQRW